MALEAIVNRNGVYKVILEAYPEGVYVLVYAAPNTEHTIRDGLQDTWEIAKLACLDDYGVTDNMWVKIPNTGYKGIGRVLED